MAGAMTWHVLLVRYPVEGGEAAVRALLPSGSWSARQANRVCPVVVWSGADPAEAERTAARLRARGAVVVVVEDADDASAFCTFHPGQLAGDACRDCGVAICAVCWGQAGGSARCPPCARRLRRQARNERLRQLFAVFVLAAVIYQAWRYGLAEQEWLPPLGPVSVAVIQVVRPEAAGHPLVRTLNAVDEPTSLRAVEGWYQQEYERYTGRTSPYLRVVLHGPWGGEVTPPPLEEPDAPAWRLAWNAWRYPRYFHGIARSRGVDPDGYGARVYVVYGKERGDLAADSRGSRNGRFAVAFVPVDTASAAYAQVTVAHELAHILGAEDLYTDAWRARFPQGLVEPFAAQPYPQRYAELMAVDVPVSPTVEREPSSLTEVRIGYHTAAKLGWIAEAQAAVFYGQAGLTAVLPGPTPVAEDTHAPIDAPGGLEPAASPATEGDTPEPQLPAAPSDPQEDPPGDRNAAPP